MKQHLLALLLGTALFSTPATAAPVLEQVASFDQQVTGVAVSKGGRVFVNFPRWSEDVAVSVAEVVNGELRPYPDEQWNSWRNISKDTITPHDHFVCVQSVVVDNQDNLWVLDPAAPNTERIVPNGPKLVKIDLATNTVAKVIPFDTSIAPTGSYLNDVRFSPDGRMAYITDSGQGAIIVVDTDTGTSRRLLKKDPTVMAEKGVVVMSDGKELRRPDGRTAEFNADGIALSQDGSFLYWQAITGRTLYRITTSALHDESLSAEALRARIETVGQNGVADGLWLDKQNRMIITSPEDSSLKIRAADAEPVIWIQDARLRWPDSLAEGPDGAIYVTTSHIQDSPWFNPSATTMKTELWRVTEINTNVPAAPAATAP